MEKIYVGNRSVKEVDQIMKTYAANGYDCILKGTTLFAMKEGESSSG